MINPYEALGIKENATRDEIKKARRDAARKLHPDRKKDADKIDAGKQLAIINGAADLLLNPEKRAHYDATGEDQKGNPAYNAFRDLAANLIDSDDIESANIIEAGKQHVNDAIRELHNTREKIKKSIAKLEKKKGRFVTSADHNIFEGVINSKIEDARKNVAMCTAEMDKAKQVLEYFDAYEDTGATYTKKHKAAFGRSFIYDGGA